MITKVIEVLGGFPLDASQMKTHLKFTSDKENALIGGYISAAVQYAESRMWRKLVYSRMVGLLDDFPGDDDYIEVSAPPLVDVDGIEYRTPNGQVITLDASKYRVHTEAEPGRIEIINHWPATDGKTGAVRITFTAGYQSPSQVPPQIMQGVQMLTAHFFRNRSAVVVSSGSVAVDNVPIAADALFDMYSTRVPL